MTLLVVALGGAAGALSRYWAIGWVQALVGIGFPWGTLAVNVTGSLALGFTLVWLQSMAPSAELRDLIAVGFLGSFTTFSTFSWETLTLIREGAWERAGAYTLASVAICVLACAVGAALATALWGRR
ncbi:MAG TPA: fluoride efflux transporter CrcB [Longimicrobiales bacterium]|nr:fluoride efflux transporter CrcB [Longimicrobiales bacterium]